MTDDDLVTTEAFVVVKHPERDWEHPVEVYDDEATAEERVGDIGMDPTTMEPLARCVAGTRYTRGDASMVETRPEPSDE